MYKRQIYYYAEAAITLYTNKLYTHIRVGWLSFLTPTNSLSAIHTEWKIVNQSGVFVYFCQLLVDSVFYRVDFRESMGAMAPGPPPVGAPTKINVVLISPVR